MKKKELIYAVSERAGITLKDTKLVIEALIDTIHENVKKTDVSIPSLGTFKVVKQSKRTGRNPMTGEAIEIAAKRRAFFKVSSSLKRIVNS